MSIRLVPFSGEHVAAAAALETLCFSLPWSERMLADELQNDMASYIAAVDDDGTLVGYAGLHVVLDEGYITNIAVHPDRRRQGIARRLLEVFLRFGAQTLAFLTLEVRRSNAPALALYTALGFSEAGVRRNYYEQPTEDAVIMTLHFAANSQEECTQ